MNVNTKEIIAVYQFMLHALLQGKSIRADVISDELKIKPFKIKLIIDYLSTQGALYRDSQDRIKAIYPFSIMVTPHHVINRESNISYANCALDALTIPAIFKTTINIDSRCEACNESIKININDTIIESYSPPETVVWEQKRTSNSPAKISVCPGTNFFCCRNCAEEYHKNESGLRDNLLTLDEAMNRVKTWCSFIMYSKITNPLINEAS